MGLSDLPLASGQKHKQVFESIGWQCRRDGNHIIMVHTRIDATVSIPNHNEVKRETLKSILRSIGYSDKQYRGYFDLL